MEENLLRDRPEADVIADKDLLLLADVCDEEHKGVCKRFTLVAKLTVVF